MFLSSVCIALALFMVTIHIACYNGDIEEDPGSKKVPLLLVVSKIIQRVRLPNMPRRAYSHKRKIRVTSRWT